MKLQPIMLIFQRFIELGQRLDDSEEVKLRKGNLLVMSGPFALFALVWGTLYIANGLVIPGLIPLFYGFFSLSSIVHFSITARYRFFINSQLLLILILPFLLQISLGGFIPGSAVIIWAIIAPLGALVFHSIYKSLFWFSTYALLTIISFLINDTLSQYINWNLQTDFIQALLLMNILGVSTIVFLIQYYFVGKVSELRENIERKNIVLEEQAKNLKEMNKVRSSFFASISHEFRTPLTLILAPLENELNKKPSPEGKESLLLMKRSAERLLDLINQLLDLSKLESGKMDLTIRQGNLNQFLSVMVASFNSLAENKQIEFIKNISIGNGQYWYDQDKVEKIITNLLANAFKYTPSGGAVTIAIATVNDKSLSIIVSDTGPGIPKEEQANVFLPFYQTRQTTPNHQVGTGLGVSLIKELVKLYNGTISLLSDPGIGTSFSVSIPVNKEAFTSEQIIDHESENFISNLTSNLAKNHIELSNSIEQAEALNGKDSVLVVEDNADMREFIAATLQNNNYAVLTASNGIEALPLALRFVPSLILSDLLMPRMDGMAFTKKIKYDERTSHIPVIVLTAKNEQQSRLEGLKTGADDYLTKPFSTEELLIRIANLIEQRKKLAVLFREQILVSATPTNESSLEEKFLQKVRQTVETNMGDFSFTVEKMADDIILSRTQLLRKLKALTGLSPHEFIKDLRLQKAADMIRLRVDTITQIAYVVGFNDQSYFTKCFKKKFGVTPTEFSLRTLKIGNEIQLK